MIFDYKTLITLNGAKLYNNLYNNFNLYCFTIIILKEKRLYIEFSYTLSKTSALIKQIL
jgi:hypothetical protein